jgi:hypothetical protein
MARKEDKLRPYRIDYFDIDEMKDVDLALIRSTVVRAVTSDLAIDQFASSAPATGRIVVRCHRFYKKLGAHKKDVYKAIEDLYAPKAAAQMMDIIEGFRQDQAQTAAGLFDAPDTTGHVTRMSDSSLYDEVCIHCGATDASGKLNEPCPSNMGDGIVSEALEHYNAMMADHATPDPAYGVQKATFYKNSSGTTVQTPPITPCHCSFAFPMSSEAMVLHMQTFHNVPPTSGPDSPPTKAVVADLQGMLAHDAHEQIMDKVVVDSTDAEGRRFPTPANTLEHGDDIAAAVSGTNPFQTPAPADFVPTTGCGCDFVDKSVEQESESSLVGNLAIVIGVVAAIIALMELFSRIGH